MDAEFADRLVAQAAAAIAEPARARMLCSLMDGAARTGTELAAIAEVSASTASVHLAKLKDQNMVKVLAQGRHRYYSIGDPRVAAALEALMVLAGSRPKPFVPSTPQRLRLARTCYDHMAGTLAVALHDKLFDAGWLKQQRGAEDDYDLTPDGERGLAALEVDVDGMRKRRRRFACACLDWSERRPHLGGAAGAALLETVLRLKWANKDLDGRGLRFTPRGREALARRFGVPTELGA
ncbi:MAG: helix-turn-helix domain-containing protein [Pseudomonadota bacterium]